MAKKIWGLSDIPEAPDYQKWEDAADKVKAAEGNDYVLQEELEPYAKKTDLAGFTTEADVEEKIASSVSSVFKYKGSVASVDALPTEGNTIGDCWNVEDNGDNYAWNGESWDNLRGKIDLSSYATNEKLNTELAKKADLVHVHQIASITGLRDQLDALQPKGEYVTSAQAADFVTKEDLSDTLDDYATAVALEGLATKQEVEAKADKAHTHAIADVDGLQSALDGKQASGNYALKTEIPSLTEYAKTADIEAVYAKKTELPSLDAYAQKSELTNLATKAELQAKLDTSTYTSDKATFALKTEIPDISNLATKSEIPDISALATKTEVSAKLDTSVYTADKSTFALKSELEAKADVDDIPSIEGLAPLASPAFTGNVTVPAPSADMNPATKQYVDNLISQLNSRVSALETPSE